MLEGKHIVLGITGGIAAYKSVMLLRLFIKAGAEVQVIMTPNAREFVAPVTFSSLSGKPVVTDFFSANTGEWHSHVELGVWADLMVIAPATASTLGKMANGIADNMLVTTYLSAKEEVMVAPAMDLDMWKHPSTQRNIKQLREDGVMIIEPGQGSLASGLDGKGRMAEPEEILQRVVDYFHQKKDLKGLKAVVTAGPTYEKIDPVRFIGNFSSGKMGFSLAEELASRGAEVTIVTGPVNINLKDKRIKRVDVVSAKEMHEAAELEFQDADIAIFSAAVADYAPEKTESSKIKREKNESYVLQMRRNPDIAYELSNHKGNRITVGFALETDNELENAEKKLRSKQLDIIVLNSMKDPEAGFMKSTNKVTILTDKGEVKEFNAKPKREVAKDIVDVIVKYKNEKRGKE